MKRYDNSYVLPDDKVDEPIYLASEVDVRIHDLESGLRELLQDTQHADHNCGDGPDLCPVARARELLEPSAQGKPADEVKP